MNQTQIIRSKRYIDLHNQIGIIKYLCDNNFRKVDTYRDANCIARCIAAKVFEDESQYNRIRYGIYKQLRAQFVINA